MHVVIHIVIYVYVQDDLQVPEGDACASIEVQSKKKRKKNELRCDEVNASEAGLVHMLRALRVGC